MQTAPLAPTNSDLIDGLETHLNNVLDQVRNAPFFIAITDPNAPTELVFAFMREIFLDVYAYQKRIDEVVFQAVGRFGHHIDEQPLVRALIAVQIEETGHGTLALEDHVALGGDRQLASTQRPTPHAAAVIAVTRYLCTDHHPAAHLGFMYFFERFTTMIVELVAPTLERHGYPNDRLTFMRLHAEEDIRHADMLANLITEIDERYPDARQEIEYGFQCFRAVYPLPVWGAAFERAAPNHEQP